MRISLFLSALFFFAANCLAQTQIDGSFPFQTDLDKKYTLIVPSTYDANSPTKVMLGLHPLNPARWSGKTWCEYLTEFAENNNLLLVCPDGGLDGKIDDPIDTAFTSVLLDSVGIWYQIQSDKVYAMGFSWGGRTTYTYGLSNTDRLHGFMPIGAAMSGVNINAIASNAAEQPFYFIHGGNDNPNGNLNPFKDLLEDNGAFINSKVLPGVGHTIDFADNLAILTEAYIWIDSVNCDTSSVSALSFPKKQTLPWSIAPNPVHSGEHIRLEGIAFGEKIKHYSLFDIEGRLLRKEKVNIGSEEKVLKGITTQGLESGLYFLMIERADGRQETQRLVIR